jgi:hypothetical protein
VDVVSGFNIIMRYLLLIKKMCFLDYKYLLIDSRCDSLWYELCVQLPHEHQY